MNAWPVANEWMRFAGTLAVELAVVFAVAKLLAFATKSAQAQRAIWQVTLCSALLIFIGELNGVSRWLPVPHKRVASQAFMQRTVVITLKDTPNIPPLAAPAPSVTVEEFFKVTPVRHLRWPAVFWAAGSVLVLLRLVFVEVAALVIRRRSRQIEDAAITERASQIAAALGVRQEVSVLENARVIAPLTFGARKPAVVLPRDFASTFTPAQQDAVLAHELAHVTSRDYSWRRFGEIVCALLWWHPVVWLTKRELHHASELVADEASLLLRDGPQSLAECLLVCAKRLRRPVASAWLGVDGGGFRSKLGKRVARLLAVEQRTASRSVPWPVRFVATIGCAVVFCFGAALATQSSRSGEQGWHRSILGVAFAALAEPPTKSNEETRIDVARLVQQGKLAYEDGQLDSASSNLTQALQLDPTNKAAQYYFELVEARKYAAELKLVPVETIPSDTSESSKQGTVLRNSVRTDVQREALYKKLRTIRLPDFVIPPQRLASAIKYLSDQARTHDTNGQGVPFLISGLDDKEVTIHVGKPLRSVTMEEALNIITMVADKRIKYSVESYGVVISAKPPETVPLHTRFYNVSTNTFWQNLSNLTAFSFAGNAGGAGGGVRHSGRGTNAGISSLSDATPATVLVGALRSFFQVAAVDLNEEGKAIFFNDRLGRLMVRATLADLVTIEKALGILNPTPQQITIRAKVIEVPLTRERTVDSWYPANSLITNTYNGEPVLMAVLDDEQVRSVIRNMETTDGTDLLNCPEVTTLNGRQAQIKVVDMRSIVTGFAASTNGLSKEPVVVTELVETGPIVDVVPYVAADGRGIHLTIVPTLREFLGYDDPSSVPTTRESWATGAHAEDDVRGHLKSIRPLPRFRLRTTSAVATVLDGQTLMLSGGNVRIEQGVRNRGVITTNAADKALFYFITPRLIDDTGKPLHSDAEVRSRTRRN
jgi:beta-lactamase regulating signal transducer with metallopeptidase domain